MTVDEMWRMLRDGARREWWLVAVAVAVAVAATLLAGGVPATQYRAQATIVADTGTRTEFKALPAPDDVVRDLWTSEGATAIAASAGVSVAEASKVSLSAFGNPQSRLSVTYTGPTPVQAKAVVEAANQAVLDYVARRMSVESEGAEESIAQADDSIARLDVAMKQPSLRAWERADLEYKQGQARQARLDAQHVRDVLRGAYHVQGPVTVSEVSGTSKSATRAVAGALAGLIIGLALAVAREMSLRRGHA